MLNGRQAQWDCHTASSKVDVLETAIETLSRSILRMVKRKPGPYPLHQKNEILPGVQ